MKQRERIVVTGVGIICGLGGNKDEVIANMKKNQTGIGTVKSFATDKFLSSMGAEVKDYNPSQYFSAQEEDSYDRCAQYAIIAAKEALQDSGLELGQVGSERVGLSLGTCNGGINSLEVQGRMNNLDQHLTKRYPFFQQGDDVASFFGVQGPVNTINTACAASGNAIGYAYDMIAEGYADVMIAGGSDSMSLSVYAGFNSLQALSPVPCSPYNKRFGLSLGEGAAFVVMETLSSALERGAHIYAEICGYGLSVDAYHATAPEPKGRGIKLAVEIALENAGLDKTKVGYVNTHGTGTKANDPAELIGLRSIFGEDEFKKLPISSSKAYFGHNLGAAASIEYVSTLLAMQEGFLPATLHLEEKREGCEDANIIGNEMLECSPEFFLCNNSAFGGHNASIVSRNWKVSQTEEKTIDVPKQTRVGIVGMGLINSLGTFQSGALPQVFQTEKASKECEFQLKKYDANLYERRMNRLAQFSIGAADLALRDASITVDDSNAMQIGLIYGTSRGSLESSLKYLEGILEKGPEYASSIYFPDMVLNSTAGKVAMKLGVKGYGTSLSTGGNDGLASALYGYEAIKKGIQAYCLVGAGDEFSPLATEVDHVLGLNESIYPLAEGSCFLVLADLDQAKEQGLRVYSELKGFGSTFGGSQGDSQQLERAVNTALERSGLSMDDIGFVYYSTLSLTDTVATTKQVLDGLVADRSIPVVSFDQYLGYAESTSSLVQMYMAAESIFAQAHSGQAELEAAAAAQETANPAIPPRAKHGLIVGSSTNGNYIAAVLSAIE
ncbi:beta-ketoacyl-[acyl-carrier-protein] synthase family protein [Brevibacillus dissolubilis]|uniref:beta-ketoacyl-[acyl-carrier-protein] synthase family protein n=1 Tax=Brevibacillus dissolubilis TaxID=1844116 RepID=UPI0021003638|nr:beta-ketoacyl-[acyl-carrier-protein] synthase family protein [Brevibacillus dissolubilis]